MEIIYRHFECLPSTNDWVKAHLITFPQEAITVVSAAAQTAGRGRYGRRWISPAHTNLYMTFGFFSTDAEPLVLTHLLALTTAKILQTYGVSCQIKYPNDLLVGNKKIAGILCETVPPTGIILGIGLNVNMPLANLLQVDQPATSLFVETETQHELQPLLHALSTQFATNLALFQEKGFAPFSSAFQGLLVTVPHQ